MSYASGVLGPSRFSKFIAENYLFLKLNDFPSSLKYIIKSWISEYAAKIECRAVGFPSWLSILGLELETFIDSSLVTPELQTKKLDENTFLMVHDKNEPFIAVLPIYPEDKMYFFYSNTNKDIILSLKESFFKCKEIDSYLLEDILFARNQLIQRKEQNTKWKWNLFNLLISHVTSIKPKESVLPTITVNIRVPTKASTSYTSPIYNSGSSPGPKSPLYIPESGNTSPKSPLYIPESGNTSPGYLQSSATTESTTEDVKYNDKVSIFTFFDENGNISTSDNYHFFKCNSSWILFDTRSRRHFIICHPMTKKFRLCQIVSLDTMSSIIHVFILRKDNTVKDTKIASLAVENFHGPLSFLYDTMSPLSSCFQDLQSKYKHLGKLPDIFQKEWKCMTNNHHFLEFYYVPIIYQWKTSIGMFLMENFITPFYNKLNQTKSKDFFQLVLMSEIWEKSILNRSKHVGNLHCHCCNEIIKLNQSCFSVNTASNIIIIALKCYKQIYYIFELGKYIRYFKTKNFNLEKCELFMKNINQLKQDYQCSKG